MKASDYHKQSYLNEIGRIEYDAIREGHLTDLVFIIHIKSKILFCYLKYSMEI